MALKHYGGSVPDKQTDWKCPSCGAENTVPLKAGCQSCGAGADARKAGAPGAGPRVSQRVEGRTQEEIAAVAWMRTADFPEDQVSPFANSEALKEAFMAGVAWAQAQTLNGAQAYPGGPVFPVLTEETTRPKPLKLWTDDGKHQDPVEGETLLTILAALAFYRDNVLNYNTMEGQLSGPDVTQLVERLLPKEPEA